MIRIFFKSSFFLVFFIWFSISANFSQENVAKEIKRKKFIIERLNHQVFARELYRFSLTGLAIYWGSILYDYYRTYHDMPVIFGALTVILSPVWWASYTTLGNQQRIINAQIEDFEDEIKQLEAVPVS